MLVMLMEHGTIGQPHSGTAFATKISLTDWTSKIAVRVKQPGKSVIQYAVAKEKLLAMAPVARTD